MWRMCQIVDVPMPGLSHLGEAWPAIGKEVRRGKAGRRAARGAVEIRGAGAGMQGWNEGGVPVPGMKVFRLPIELKAARRRVIPPIIRQHAPASLEKPFP